MTRPPRPRSAPLLGFRPSALAVLAGLILTLTALSLDLWMLRLGVGPASARAAALATVVLGAAFLALLDGAGVSRRARDWAVLLAVIASAPLAIELRPLASLLSLASPGPAGWLAAVALAILSVGWRALPFGAVRAGEVGRATLSGLALVFAAGLPLGRAGSRLVGDAGGGAGRPGASPWVSRSRPTSVLSETVWR